MPRITRAGRGAFALGIVGLILAVVGITAATVARLTVSQPDPSSIAAARERLSLLEKAVRSQRSDQADALAGSLAAGLGVDTPVEIAPELARFNSAATIPDRCIAIDRARAILDLLERAPRPPPSLIEVVALLAAAAGTMATTAAFAGHRRSIGQLQRDALLQRLLIERPDVRSRHPPSIRGDSSPHYGRIVSIHSVDDA